MQVSEIADKVRSLTSDQEKVVISDRELLSWVNDAILQISTLTDYKQASATTNIIYGASNYSLLDDMLKIYGVKYKTFPLDQIGWGELLELPDALGTPVSYCIYEVQIHLYPTPNENVKDGLQVYYLTTPNRANSMVDFPDLPIEYHPRIVDYCYEQALLKDSDYKAAALVRSQNQTALNNHIGARPANIYPMIRISSGD